MASKKKGWCDPSTGYTLTAGGILFYDNNGIWVIGERVGGYQSKPGVEYSDIGGRYSVDDRNIWTTIRRELNEETYGMCDIPIQDVLRMRDNGSIAYVYDHTHQPAYLCIVVHISKVKDQKYFNLDPIQFENQRKQTLLENPHATYRPISLIHFNWETLVPKARRDWDFKGPNTFIPSFRLTKIISNAKFKFEV